LRATEHNNELVARVRAIIDEVFGRAGKDAADVR
jgi:hypothetical protein